MLLWARLHTASILSSILGGQIARRRARDVARDSITK
jgi:hypothetical protein